MRLMIALSALFLSTFVGCSQHTMSSPLPALPQAAVPKPGSFKSLYSFKGNPDGQNPYAGLVVLNGTLYGTTELGGKNDFGVAYKVSTAGAERVLHTFGGASVFDGSDPYGALIVVNGALYGTTYYGGPPGATGYGSVYKVSPSGVEHIVCGFKDMADGAFPYAGVVAVSGTLYGTTYQGGKHDYGTVYTCTMSGAEHVLHSFTGAPDGAFPYAPLAVLSGALYGTTYQGGTKSSSGYGTVYKVTPSGSEHVLHRFAGTPDGAYPHAGLLALKGTLFGTTSGGGAYGNGTVFKVSPSGTERVLYSFKGSPDGAGPYAGMIAVNGTLYGTTESGGEYNQGTVYKVTTTGVEDVLHSFTGAAPDGSDPLGGLVLLKGALYGTTFYGGKSGDGIVFKIAP